MAKYMTCIRYKWTCDDIKSIDEGIARLEGRIEQLKQMKRLGAVVDCLNNQDDYIHFQGDNPKLKDLGFQSKKEFYGGEGECPCDDCKQCEDPECEVSSSNESEDMNI